MGLYRYRCQTCNAAGRPVGTRAEAEAQRTLHRRVVHGGLVPHGEDIEHVPGSTRDPDSRYVSGRGALVLLAILAVASLISRAIGH